ncbi:MAG: cache domain-containing protein, partial [Deltaproteobacteria bacterium]|nr:cache domain-containing protein [Deltaproteobacteria bacterium]
MRRLTFGKKVLILIILFVLVGIIPGLVISYESLNKSEEALEKISFEQLRSIRDIKKSQVMDYLESLQKQLRVTQNNPFVLEALIAFNRAFEDGGDKVLTASWNRVADRYDDALKKIYSINGWYDLFLIHTDGDIVYTTTRESDLGMIIPESNLRDSAIGIAFDKIMRSQTDQIAIADFKPYPPSNNEPAAFIMAKLYQKGKMEGIIALQFPIGQLNKIMQLRTGMGETGETYLVGEDMLMRSDSFLDPKNHSVKASFANPVLGKVDTEGTREALMGKTDAKVILDYNGNEVLSAYTPLQLGDLNMALIAEIDMAEVDIPVDQLASAIYLIAFIILVVVILVVIMVIVFSQKEVSYLSGIVTHLPSSADQL